MSIFSSKSTAAAVALLSAASMFGCERKEANPSGETERVAATGESASPDRTPKSLTEKQISLLCEAAKTQWEILNPATYKEHGEFLMEPVILPSVSVQNQLKDIVALTEKAKLGETGAPFELALAVRSGGIFEFMELRRQRSFVSMAIRTESAGVKPAEGAEKFREMLVAIDKRIADVAQKQNVFRDFCRPLGLDAVAPPVVLDTEEKKAAAIALVELGSKAAEKLADSNILIAYGRTARAAGESLRGVLDVSNPRPPSASDIDDAVNLVTMEFIEAAVERHHVQTEWMKYNTSPESTNSERFTEAYLGDLEHRLLGTDRNKNEAEASYKQVRALMIALGRWADK